MILNMNHLCPHHTFPACCHHQSSQCTPPSMSTPQSHQQPPSPNDVSYPSLAWSTSPQPLSHHLCLSQVLAPQARDLQMLSHETQGSQWIGADSMVQPRHSIFYYQPFITTGLLNWRNDIPLYSENSQATLNLLESIFQTHQPTWDDC
jgi:hypothetical protein